MYIYYKTIFTEVQNVLYCVSLTSAKSSESNGLSMYSIFSMVLSTKLIGHLKQEYVFY